MDTVTTSLPARKSGSENAEASPKSIGVKDKSDPHASIFQRR
jgi:hypothetical protein